MVKRTLRTHVVALVILLVGCGSGAGGNRAGDVLRFQAMGGFGISPFTASGSPNPASTPMMSLMFDTLTWRDADGPAAWLNVVSTDAPAGSSLTAAGGIRSDDGIEYRYTLRDGVTWHDGEALTADDVVFTFQYMKGRKAGGFSLGFPPPGGPGARFIDYIAAVEIDPGDPTGSTVVFKLHDPVRNPCPAQDNACLTGPWVPFEDLVIGSTPIIPRHIWGPDFGDKCHPKGDPGNICVADPVNNAPDGQYLGSGPYVLDPTTFNPDTLVARFDANPTYFRGAPQVSRIEFVPVGEGQSLNALKTGLIDGVGAGGGSGYTAETLAAFTEFTGVTGPRDGDRNITFNLTRGFPFDRKEFRQAIAYAIDRPALVTSFLDGRGEPGSDGGLSPQSPFVAPDLPHIDFDIAEANRLLDSIGVVDSDGDGMRDLPAEPCGFGPPCPDGKGGTKLWTDTGGQDLALVVADSLRQNLNLDIVAFTQEPPLFTFGNYNMALFSESNLTGDPDRLRTRFSDRITSQTFPGECSDPFGCRRNPPIMALGYDNPEFMDLADRQATEFDPSRRLTHVHRMQHLLAQDLPTISLFVGDRLFLHRPGTVPFYYTPGGVGADPQGGTTLNKQVFVAGTPTG